MRSERAVEQPAKKPQPRRTESQAEDLMFFMKLRKRAKWIFVVLAAAFAVGFIGFGIGGTGGGGVADALGDLFGRSGDALPSASEAADRLASNPNDPEARQAYADALFGEQRFEEAEAAYVSYLELAPDDTSALRQLALLYQQDVSDALGRANALQNDSLQADPATLALFDPNSTAFTQQLAQNDLEEAVATALSDRAQGAFDEAATAAAPWVATLERIAEIEPSSPTIFLQLGQAAEVADDTERAISAYLAALELDPAGIGAIQVRDQILQLGGEVPDELNALVEENAANPAVDPSTPIFERSGEGAVTPGPDGSIGEQQPIGSIGSNDQDGSVLDSDPATQSPSDEADEPPADGG